MTNAAAKYREYEPVIGLEVHAQLLTQSKMFCGCRTTFGAEPNSLTCPVCLGLPGALPTINRTAVEFAVQAIAAVGGRVNERSVFARKNYFYPDLPKGYQISQLNEPIGEGGEIRFVLPDQKPQYCRLIRIHLEEDAGKSIHPEAGESHTKIDLNRCGTPLIEIVTAPDLRSPEAAYAYLLKLKQLLQYLDICSGDMEKGHLRCDANVSVRLRGETEFGTRTEIKNMNSFKAVRKALVFEINRQEAVLSDGGKVEQATLLWDETSNIAEPMRNKEESPDYRYFPEPDLPPLEIDPEWIKQVIAGLPELPDQRRNRFVRQYAVRDYDAVILTDSRDLADYFESVMELFDDGRIAANFMLTEMLGYLKKTNVAITDIGLSADSIAGLLSAVKDGHISGSAAKTVFREMAQSGEPASVVIDRLGISQISDRTQLEEIVGKVITKSPAQVEQFRAGKEALFGYFVGQVMRATGGRANPSVVNEILTERLTG